MIHVTFQTRTVAAAEKLAAHLMEKHLLLFPTMDTDHEELLWADGKLTRTSQLLLQGMTKALLYRELEREAMSLLGHDLVRMHAVPVTNMDPEAQRQLLEQTAKV
ncbi:MAG: hypothetical protein JNL43_09920 [Flavobacteriales bacterium]|nr:hypothetical protein [Flavobacteriales bacterium]